MYHNFTARRRQPFHLNKNTLARGNRYRLALPQASAVEQLGNSKERGYSVFNIGENTCLEAPTYAKFVKLGFCHLYP